MDLEHLTDTVLNDGVTYLLGFVMACVIYHLWANRGTPIS